MKNKTKLNKLFWPGILACLVFTLMAACDNNNGNPDPGDPDLAGNITITPSGPVTTGTQLTAYYSGTENVSFQWNMDNTAVSGATGATYTPTEAGDYTVTVSLAGYNSKTSDPVTVTAEHNLSGTITITPNTGVYINTALIATYSGNETVTYQWKRDGTLISGAVSAMYMPTQAGSYTVTVSAVNYHGKTSDPVTVTAGSDLTGTITITPSGPVLVGTALTAIYSGAETVTSQWNRNGTPISGATGAIYTPSLAGSYTVTVNAAGYNGKTSAPVTVILPDLPGNVTVSPNTGVTPGTELTAAYSGSETVTGYQWNRNGTAISGATGAKHTPVQTGNYTVTVSAAGYNSKTSDPIAVRFNLSGTVTITSNTGAGNASTLTASYNGTETVSYQWNRDGTPISGANSATYTPSLAGSYTVTVSAENYHSKTSDPAIVADIDVTFTGPAEKIISINRTITNNLSKSKGGSIALAINENFDKYEWYVGTAKVADGKNVSLQADNTAFVIGNNWITVVVYTGTGTNAVPWSGEFFVLISE